MVAAGGGLKAGAGRRRCTRSLHEQKKQLHLKGSSPAISHNSACTSNVAEVALKAGVTPPQLNVSSSLKRGLHSEKCIAVKSIDKTVVCFY